MIKRFRRIRRKLISSGQLSKYLAYAIGEILLVIIGILLALQVNNWNIARKNNMVVQELSTDLLNELRGVKRLANNRLEGIEKQQKLTQYLINHEDFQMDSVLQLSSSSQIPIDPLNFLFTFRFHFNPRTDIYNSAINEGTLALIESKDISYKLNTAFTMSEKRVAEHVLAENKVNALINEHIAHEHQDLFISGTLQNSFGAWDEALTQSILSKISTDGKLRYLLSNKLQILQFKQGDLKYRIIPTIDAAITQLEASVAAAQ